MKTLKQRIVEELGNTKIINEAWIFPSENPKDWLSTREEYMKNYSNRVYDAYNKSIEVIKLIESEYPNTFTDFKIWESDYVFTVYLCFNSKDFKGYKSDSIEILSLLSILENSEKINKHFKFFSTVDSDSGQFSLKFK